MGARARSLPADEVAVGSGDAALARRNGLVVHGKAHGAAGLAPLKAGGLEHLIQALRLGLPFDVLRSRYHPGPNRGGNPPPLGHRGCRSEMRLLVQEPMNTQSTG